MNKKIIVFLLVLSGFTFSAQAQRGLKVGYIDMDYILENLPEYKQAQQRLDSKINTWRKDIEKKKTAIQKKKDELDNERPLLTAKIIEDRETEIKYLQQDLLDYQEKRFGAQGDMITQKRQLVQPIQDQVFNAVQEIGRTRQYDFIFENTENALLLFSATRHDISDQVLSKIKRSSRELDRKKRKAKQEEEPDDAALYKSVEQAAADKKEAKQQKEEREAEEAKREAEEQKRQDAAEERQRKRDSIRDAKRQKIEDRRQKQMEQRQQRRDSIRQARKQEIENRKKERQEERQKRRQEKEND